MPHIIVVHESAKTQRIVFWSRMAVVTHMPTNMRDAENESSNTDENKCEFQGLVRFVHGAALTFKPAPPTPT
eukprot:3448075-Prymnesium_polylepis.2